MPQELGPNQRKWIAALRSGAFKQTDLWLETPEGNCCLGVWCRLQGLEGTPAKTTHDPPHTMFGQAETVLTVDSYEELGLLNENGEIRGGWDGFDTLTDANDHGKTFSQIADFCEAHPEAVFTEAR